MEYSELEKDHLGMDLEIGTDFTKVIVKLLEAGPIISARDKRFYVN